MAEEARYILRTEVWKYITASLSEEARKVMFNRAVSFDDLRNGKMILWTADIQTKLLESFAKNPGTTPMITPTGGGITRTDP